MHDRRGRIIGAGLAADGADRINSAITGEDRVVPKVIRKGAKAVGIDPTLAVAAYEGAAAALTITTRVLEVAVPAAGGSPMQAAVMNEMIQYGASKGVIVIFTPI